MKYTGRAVSAGVAMGKAYLYQGPALQVDSRPGRPFREEWEAYQAGRLRAAAELEELKRRFEARGELERAAIFGAQLELLSDEVMEGEIRERLAREGCTAAFALHGVLEGYALCFEALEDPVFREKGADLRDVGGRLLRCLAGAPEQDLPALEEPVILIARELSPSQAASLDQDKVLGVALETGGGRLPQRHPPARLWHPRRAGH